MVCPYLVLQPDCDSCSCIPMCSADQRPHIKYRPVSSHQVQASVLTSSTGQCPYIKYRPVSVHQVQASVRTSSTGQCPYIKYRPVSVHQVQASVHTSSTGQCTGQHPYIKYTCMCTVLCIYSFTYTSCWATSEANISSYCGEEFKALPNRQELKT